MRTGGDAPQPIGDDGSQCLAPVAGRTAQVIYRAGVVERERAGLRARGLVQPPAREKRLRRTRPHDGRRHAAQRQTCLAHYPAVEVHDERDIDHGDRLRAAQPELDEETARRRWQCRHAYLADQLVRAQHGATKAGIELAQWHHPLASSARQYELGPERDQRRDGVVGRRSRDEVAGDGGARANLGRADLPARLCQRQRALDAGARGQHIVVGGKPTEQHITGVCADVLELAQRRDVDQRLSRLHATRKLDDHIRPARDDPRPLAVPRQHVERLRQARRAQVRLPHADSLPFGGVGCLSGLRLRPRVSSRLTGVTAAPSAPRRSGRLDTLSRHAAACVPRVHAAACP